MTVDWGFAGKVGGIGFGLVFVVLIILALAMWLIGVAMSKIGASKTEASKEKKGD